jgi:hypothetical protein
MITRAAMPGHPRKAHIIGLLFLILSTRIKSIPGKQDRQASIPPLGGNIYETHGLSSSASGHKKISIILNDMSRP